MLRKKRLFRVFLLELLVMALIPLVILTGYIQGSVLKSFGEKVNELQKNYFLTAGYSIEDALEKAFDVAVYITEDSRVQDYLIAQNRGKTTSVDYVLNEYEIRKQLKTFIETNSDIASIYIYNDTMGQLLNSGGGSAKISDFYDTEWLEECSNLYENQSIAILPERETRTEEYSYLVGDFPAVISVAVPIIIKKDINCKALIMVNIRKDMLLDIETDEEYSYILYDDQNNVITSFFNGTEDEQLSEEIVSKYPYGHSDSNMITEETTQKYVSYYEELSQFHVTFSVYTSELQLQNSVNNMKYFVLLILICSVLLCIFMAYRLAVKYCVPIITISQGLKEYMPDNGDSDRLKNIIEAASSFFERQHELEQESVTSLDTVFQPLISENKTDDARYFCIVASIDGYLDFMVTKKLEEINSLKKQFIHKAAEKFPESVIRCKSFVFVNDKLIFVYQCRADITKAEIRNIAEDIVRIHDFGIQVSLGIGGVYDTSKDLFQSYMEADEAVKYRLVLGKGCIAEYEKLISGRKRYKADIPQMSQLSLESGAEQMCLPVKKYFEELKPKIIVDGNAVLEYVMPMISDLSYFLSVNNISINDLMEQEEPVYLTILKMDTFDEIYDYICKIYNAVFCLFKNRESGNEYMSRINSIIKAEYSNPQLDIGLVAESIGISYSYICKIVKEETQHSFTIVLNQYRIQMAKKLLLNTNKPIKEIAEAVGYVNEQSFTRYFKKFEDMTPGRYRKIYTLQK